MADNEQISEKLKSVRTIEDVVNLLSILFTNLNNQSEQYYDMFWNPTPMDLDLEKYNEKGELVVVQHPNVAKMRISTYSGVGSPEGVLVANMGAFYIDTTSGDLYYKAADSGSSAGWRLIWNINNLRANVNYLAPDGNGSKLRELNADEIKRGTLDVPYGGTGVNSITGLIKGNGTEPFSEAIVDEDYLAPSSFTGLIMYSPVIGSVTTGEVRPGWLVCDGASYLKANYTRLYNYIGDKYKKEGDSENTFRVPNLIGRYIKGGVSNVGGVGSAHIGAHAHTGSTNNMGAHFHGLSPRKSGGTAGTSGGYGSTRLFGTFITKDDNEPFTNADGTTKVYGALWMGNKYKLPDGKKYTYKSDYGGSSTKPNSVGYLGIVLDSNRENSWAGTMTTEGGHTHSVTTNTSGEGTNDVDHIIMVPIIKY